MPLIRNKNASDKNSHRMVTVGFLVLLVAMTLAAKAGWLGQPVERVWLLLLILGLPVVIGRAILTELGIRRRSG